MASAPASPPGRSPRGSAVDRAIGQALFGVCRTLWAGGQAACRTVGVTAPQGRLLMAIAVDGPARPSELARQLGLSRQALSSALRFLEREGLLERTHAVADRREVRLAFTAKGRRRWRALSERMHLLHRRVNRLFPPSEHRRVVAALDRIQRGLSGGAAPAAIPCAGCRRDRRRR